MSEPKPLALTEAQRLDWLRLIRTENVGPRTFLALVERYGSAKRALAVLPDLARRGGAARAIRVPSLAEAKREAEALARVGGVFVASCEPDYPAALKAIDTMPPVIAVRGTLAILSKPMVAIVGSRNASGAGLVFTERLARGLAEAGFVVVSGLARGIDARAHHATIDSGTVAVLPGGHDHIYPPEHLPLLNRLIERGAAISEMPMGSVPRGQDFPRRNRIVSGMALGTVVIEAARRSGSLITARLANEQGREVFAVPGSPLDARAEGTNDLLRQGATLCTRPDDVIDALLPLVAKGVPRQTRNLSDADAPIPWEIAEDPVPPSAIDGDAPAGHDVAGRIAALLGPAPIGLDDLTRSVGVPVREVQQAVLELELAGRLVRHGGNLVSLAWEA